VSTDGSMSKDLNLEIAFEEFQQNAEKYQPIDVREEYEWEELLPGTQNIPFEKLIENPKILKKEIQYLLICDNGIKSKIITKSLREKFGFSNVFSLKGGANSLK